jgi:RNA polymerase sigma factor (sigma-70 family)
MDYKDIEKTAALAKLGDIKAKEALAQAFKPLIAMLTRKSFINSYEAEDIRSECLRALYKSVAMYTPHRQCFAAYASRAMKNSVHRLIRDSVRRSSSEGPVAFIFDDKLEDMLYSNPDEIDDVIIKKADKAKLRVALEKLSSGERELVSQVYFKSCSLKKYSELKGITYNSALRARNDILKKLHKELDSRKISAYKN